jgi:hypothetical protein
MQRLHLFFIFILFFSCKEPAQKNLPGYSGASGDLVIVIEDSVWNSAETILKATFSAAQYGLPKEEPLFNVINASAKAFDKIFITYRNLVLVNITGNAETKPKLEIKKNSWALGQIVASISVSDTSALKSLLENYGNHIIRSINNEEYLRLTERNKKFGEKQVSEQIKKTLGIETVIQKDVVFAKQEKDFIWLRIERERPVGGYKHQISQGILLYSVPYKDTTDFSVSYLLSIRDSMLKKHVEGPKGSYMSTEYNYIEPKGERISINDSFAYEIRGLWKMDGVFMGGPFILVAFPDISKNRIIITEGHVFAPQFDKREYLREVEAMVKSVQFH